MGKEKVKSKTSSCGVKQHEIVNIQAYCTSRPTGVSIKTKQTVAYYWATMLCKSPKTHQLEVACELKLQVSQSVTVRCKKVIYAFELSNKR